MMSERTSRIATPPPPMVAWSWKRCIGCDTFVQVPDCVNRYWCENCVWQPGDWVTVTFQRGNEVTAVTGVLLGEYIAGDTGVHMADGNGRARVIVPSLVHSVRAACDEASGF